MQQIQNGRLTGDFPPNCCTIWNGTWSESPMGSLSSSQPANILSKFNTLSYKFLEYYYLKIDVEFALYFKYCITTV